MTDIYRTFCDYINDHDMFRKNDHVIAGVSGGADSLCLLVLLEKLAQERSFALTAVHVNHQLRGEEADGDEAFVKEFCKKRKIRCVAVHADVKKYSEEHKITLEEAGRIARYQTFVQVAKKIGGSDRIPRYVKAAVAHHRDDNAETILMHLIRGSGMKGLKGMPPVAERFGITVVRPLLCLGRNDIEEYLLDEKVDYRTDSTNLEDDFTRNKMRLHIIPKLQEINPKASEHINEASQAIVLAQDFIEQEAARASIGTVDERADGHYIDLDRFSLLHDAVKGQIIRNIIEKLTGSLKDVCRVHIENVLALQNLQTGRKIELPGGVLALRSYSNIVFRKTTPGDAVAKDMTDYARNKGMEAPEAGPAPRREPEAFVIDPGRLSEQPVRYHLWKGVEIELQLVHVNPVTRQYLIARNEYTKAFDCAKIKGNLIIRRPDPHDVIQFSGGRKTVRKFFVDEKVPQEERQNAVVLSDENQVMWIIGYRMSEAYKLSELTNLAVQVSIIGG